MLALAKLEQVERSEEVEGLEALGEQIAELAAQIEAATHRLLALIRDFDAQEGWVRAGARSCAHWLSWRIGLGLPAARERVRVARALGELPLIDAAISRGRISYSKVRALTRVATADNEALLLSYAGRSTASQLERIVRLYRGVQLAERPETAEAQHEGRCLRTWTDDDGMLVLEGRLSPELGAVLLAALDGAAAQLPRPGIDRPQRVSAETRPVDQGWDDLRPVPTPRETAAQQRADALGLVAQSALDHRLRRGSAGDRTQVVLHVDADALTGDAPEKRGPGSPSCSALRSGVAALPCRAPRHGPGGPGRCCLGAHEADVSSETARRLSCDASVVPMSHGARGEVLDVGRKQRTIPPAIRRALAARDRTCCFPGCDHRRDLQAHHVRHWADGGPTALDNLIHVCTFHHRLLHEEGFSVARARDGLRFFDPRGRQLVATPEPPPVAGEAVRALAAGNARRGLAIDAESLTTWQGERIDCDWAVQLLLTPA